MSFDVLAEGLQFPEGPIAMPDGSVILVEIARGTLSRVWNGRTEVICDLGGGPNGAARPVRAPSVRSEVRAVGPDWRAVDDEVNAVMSGANAAA